MIASILLLLLLYSPVGVCFDATANIYWCPCVLVSCALLTVLSEGKMPHWSIHRWYNSEQIKITFFVLFYFIRFEC